MEAIIQDEKEAIAASRCMPLLDAPGRYGVIYADPPWEYDDKMDAGRRLKYPTMSLEGICSLPIKDIAAQDSALFMWCTWPHYEDAPLVMRAWGFKFKTVGFVWVKTTKAAQVNQFSFLPQDSFDETFGQGHWTRSCTEYCLIGVKGKPRPVRRDVRQVIYEPRGKVHSRKPDEARKRIVQLMGDVPRVELFVREQPEGWHVWGNEVDCTIQLGRV